MKQFLSILAMLVVPSSAWAFEGTSGPTVLAYWQLPIDGPISGSSAPFGFRVGAQIRELGGTPASHSNDRPAMLDMKFARSGLLGIFVGGVNLAPRTGIFRAAGDSAPGTEINWWIVGGLVGVAIAVARNSDESDDGRTCVASYPPPSGC